MPPYSLLIMEGYSNLPIRNLKGGKAEIFVPVNILEIIIPIATFQLLGYLKSLVFHRLKG